MEGKLWIRPLVSESKSVTRMSPEVLMGSDAGIYGVLEFVFSFLFRSDHSKPVWSGIRCISVPLAQSCLTVSCCSAGRLFHILGFYFFCLKLNLFILFQFS